ncbi:MAG: SMC-Scp complex subunit ScpB [Ruminococcaceae bacterium]|nr:SMC-Scp complex subunit ScpB [Oscillospiraceae bacterium]
METEIIEDISSEESAERETDCEEIVTLNIEEEDPPEDLDVPHACKIIEAVLFAAGYPVGYNTLAKVLEISAGAAKKIVRDYAEDYNREDGLIPRGIMLIPFDSACQLCTKEQFGQYVRSALGIRRGGNLSQSSIETLAVIAYNEPVTRAFVDTVRGVDSSYAVTNLREKELIEPCGRLDVPGRPRLYRTTSNFLRVFGLTSLEDLPEVPVPTSDITQLSIDTSEDEGAE